MFVLTTLVTAADRYHDHMGWDGNGWMWLWGLLIMLAIIALVVAAAWLVLRDARPRPSSGDEEPRRILAERFARGEISTEEYHERLEALQGRPPASGGR